jgi:hypothetical protein
VTSSLSLPLLLERKKEREREREIPHFHLLSTFVIDISSFQ